MGHVGGSLLPSSEPRILRAVETVGGAFQVRVISELDTHGLFHRHAQGETLLATHPNGYSCYALLAFLIAGNVDAAKRQIQYILDCGGTARHPDHVCATVETA